MSQTYLDKFRSALPTTQGNQILKLLISKRDSGELRTVDEFRDRLKELTSELLAERITPTLKLWMAAGGADTSSEQYNDMLDRIRDDLEAAFDEADNLDEVIEAHHNLVNNVALKALRFGVNELESKISLYEFLNRSGKGFDAALFNTFRESQNLNTSRSDNAASLVYVDPRKGQTIFNDEDAAVDLVGERLILGAEETRQLQVRQARWLSNSDSIRSELNVEFRNSRISNITDNKKNTYWVIPVLLRQPRPEGVPMEISLGMSAAQDVNFVEIEPATNFPMVLLGVDYFDANNNRQSTGATEVLLRGPTRINFGRITTSHIVLRFRQDNGSEVQFKRQPGESNFHRAVLGENSDSVDLDSVSEDLREMLTSDFILSDIMGANETTQDQLKYYEYILGFDNIRVGFSTFNERAIFVSKKQTVMHPGQVALRVDEVRPVQVAGSTSITLEPYKYPAQSVTEDANFYHSAVEYYVAIQLFSDDNFLISTDIVPVLPLGAAHVSHEQLVFSLQSTGAQNPNVAQLQHYTDATDDTSVNVYRNGTQLVYGTSNDWVLLEPSDDPLNATQNTPGAGAMKKAIKIIDTVQPLDIYTVSYTPTVSNTSIVPHTIDDVGSLLKITDLVGDRSVRVTTDNVIVFDTVRQAYAIERAEMYLLIVMRRNSADQNFSPAVEEYMLVTGSKDLQKFVGEQ